MSLADVYNVVSDNIEDLFPTGSKYICDPPVTNTDEDWMLHVKQKNLPLVFKDLHKHRFQEGLGSSEPPSPSFGDSYSFKSYHSKLNIIIATDKTYFEGFRAATELAKKLNLTEKHERVKLFQLTLGEKITV